MALLKIPVAPTRGTAFDYKGNQLTLSPVRFNPYIDVGVWVVDLTWVEGDTPKGVYGIVIAVGIDILAQYAVPIPSLFVLSSESTNKDIVSTTDLNLYIKEREV